MPQWEHVDLTDGPQRGVNAGGNCTSLVSVDDFLNSKPKKPRKRRRVGMSQLSASCTGSKHGPGVLHIGSGCVAAGAAGRVGSSRPSSATCMRCEACKKSGNLYDISEDSNHLLEQLGGGRGQTPAQRRRAFSGKPLRRQHSYDAFVDLQRENLTGIGAPPMLCAALPTTAQRQPQRAGALHGRLLRTHIRASRARHGAVL